MAGAASDLRQSWDDLSIGACSPIVLTELDHLLIKKTDPTIVELTSGHPLWWEALPLRPERTCMRRAITTGHEAGHLC